MSRMYRARPPAGPLEQGDVLRAVPQPILALVSPPMVRGTEESASIVSEDEGYQIKPDDHVVTSFVLVDAIVLTQSCDALRKNWILLAPIEPFEPSPKPVARAKAVQRLATALGDVGAFYLPDLPQLGWERRQAQLDQAFTLPRAQLTAYVQTHQLVVAGLTGPAVEYLQHRIGLVFGRLARDDYSWPSVEDLDDRVAFLTDRQQSVRGKLKKTNDEDEAADLTVELEYLEQEVAAAEEARQHVVDHCSELTSTPTG